MLKDLIFTKSIWKKHAVKRKFSKKDLRIDLKLCLILSCNENCSLCQQMFSHSQHPSSMTWYKNTRNMFFQYATLLENIFFKLTAFKCSLLNAPWIKTILFTQILFHLPTIKLRWRMIHSKQWQVTCFEIGCRFSFPSTVVNKVKNKINILHYCKRSNKSLSKHEDTHLRCNIFYEGQLLIRIYLFQDTIGAGDSFIAGFIFVLLREGSLRSCIEYAVSLNVLYKPNSW